MRLIQVLPLSPFSLSLQFYQEVLLFTLKEISGEFFLGHGRAQLKVREDSVDQYSHFILEQWGGEKDEWIGRVEFFNFRYKTQFQWSFNSNTSRLVGHDPSGHQWEIQFLSVNTKTTGIPDRRTSTLRERDLQVSFS